MNYSVMKQELIKQQRALELMTKVEQLAGADLSDGMHAGQEIYGE